MNRDRPIVFGIPHCDTVKKSRAWLVVRSVNHDFHDFKKQGVPIEEVERWLAELGIDKLLNRRGSTWRKLGVATQTSIVDVSNAKKVMQANSSVIKRPIVVWPNGQISVGFDEVTWIKLLKTSQIQRCSSEAD